MSASSTVKPHITRAGTRAATAPSNAPRYVRTSGSPVRGIDHVVHSPAASSENYVSVRAPSYDSSHLLHAKLRDLRRTRTLIGRARIPRSREHDTRTSALVVRPRSRE